LEAADLDVPARPLAVCLDAQFKGDELGKLEGFFRIRKLANPKMTFGAQRAREREAISMHGKLVPGYPRSFLAKRPRRSANPLLKILERFATKKSPCGPAHPRIPRALISNHARKRSVPLTNPEQPPGRNEPQVFAA
jgi:hypothetical protein